jgi:hypothetical protein
MGSSPDVPKPKDPLNLANKQSQKLLGYYGSQVPEWLKLQDQLGPQIMGRMFGQVGQFLGGVDGQPGLQSLQRTTAQEAGQTLGQLRSDELGQMSGQAGLTRQLMQSLSPEQAAQVSRMQQLASDAAGAEGGYSSRMGQALGTYGITPQQFNPNVSQQELGSTITQRGLLGETVTDQQVNPNITSSGLGSTATQRGLLGNTLSQGGALSPTIQAAQQNSEAANKMAQEAFTRRGTLSPEEQRMAQQSARESFGEAGRLGGNFAVASEILNREQALAGRRAEASRAEEQAFGQRQNLANLRMQEQQALFGQQVGSRQLQTAEEQALFGQQMSAREQALQQEQALFGQNAGVAQQVMSEQSGRFGQELGSAQQNLNRQQSLFQQRMAAREQGLQQEQALFGQGATSAQQRFAQQQALFGQQIAGSQQTMGMQQAGLGQLQGIEETRARLRESAGTEAGRAFSAAGGFYTAPGLNLLGQAPLSYQAGQQTLGTALSMGPASSGQFDYNAPLNFAQQRASALDKQAMAQYQADQQQRAQTMGLITKGIGLAAAPFTGGLSAGLGLSGLAGGAGAATGLGGMGLSAGMGLSNLFGGIPKATQVY